MMLQDHRGQKKADLLCLHPLAQFHSSFLVVEHLLHHLDPLERQVVGFNTLHHCRVRVVYITRLKILLEWVQHKINLNEYQNINVLRKECLVNLPILVQYALNILLLSIEWNFRDKKLVIAIFPNTNYNLSGNNKVGNYPSFLINNDFIAKTFYYVLQKQIYVPRYKM